MMKTRRFAAMILPVLLMAAGCDGALALKGIVRDATGEPLRGATVSVRVFEEFQGVAETDSSGSFTFSVVVPPGDRAFPVVFELPGFDTAHADVSGYFEKPVLVTLAPGSTADRSSVRFVSPP